jgi:hypothetical protein
MPTDNRPETVYHGTDVDSAESIQRIGLNKEAWRNATDSGGRDDKGFSVTIDRATAKSYAQVRAGQRARSKGVVLQADARGLPLRKGRSGEWTDPGEWFIYPEDFPQVGPEVFQVVEEVPPLPGLTEPQAADEQS